MIFSVDFRLENIEKLQQQLNSMPVQSAQQPIVPYATEKDIENVSIRKKNYLELSFLLSLLSVLIPSVPLLAI